MGHAENGEIAAIHTLDTKLYAKRWFLLTLFMLFTSNVAVHWTQFVSITHLVSRYYNVSPTLVEWTSTMVMAARAFLLFPSLFLIEKLETKNTLTLACLLCLIGCAIKTFSVAPNLFYVAFIGQIFSALSLVFTYSLIGRFSSAWFSSNEISRAGAFCSIGESIGGAFGYLLPNQLVPDVADKEEIQKGLQYLNYCYLAWAVTTVILVFIFFKSKPKRPPSAAQALKRLSKNRRVFKSVKELLGNSNFVLFVMTQALFVGCGSNAFGTLLNEMIVTNFPGYSKHTGILGCSNQIFGIAGSVVLSYIQDKTRKYKCMAVSVSLINCICLALVTVAMKLDNILYVYITYTIYGFFMVGYYAATIQMGIELSFPVQEGITVATISVCVELVSMTATSTYGLAMKRYGDLATNICATLLLLLSTIAVCFVPPKFRREEVEKAAKSAEMEGLFSDSEKTVAATTSKAEKV